MAKKPKTQKKSSPEQDIIDRLPPDIKERFDKNSAKFEKFKTEVLKKFESYVKGIAYLPPPPPIPGQPSLPGPLPPLKKDEKPNPDEIQVLVLVDDGDSKKMSKQELKDKLNAINDKIAKEIDKNMRQESVLLSELWQSCYDNKFELSQTIATGAPIFDDGILKTIKIAEIHKSMVLKKFEKYIVSYVVAGSVKKGTATEKSDIDVYIVIDDTDVKRMTRAELKDKLRAIIIGMGLDAGDLTGIKNKLHIQVYILTEFWDALREANPVIFTLLRDSVPFYDRGIYMAWKQLLDMGKIKPSPEAIDMFLGSGEQMVSRMKFKLRDMAMEDSFLAILTPIQAALMHYGVPPPAPKETAQVLRDIFVKDKLLEEKYVKIYERSYKIRKEIEHGDLTEVSGKQIDDLLKDSQDFLKRIKKLFAEIEVKKEKNDVLHIYENVLTVVRDVLKLEGIERINDNEALKVFERELITTAKLPQKHVRLLENIINGKKQYDKNTLTKTDVEMLKKDSSELLRELIEYLQRKRGKELERARIRVKHGERYGEVYLFDDTAFIIHDLDHEEKEVSKAPINKDGSIGTTKQSSMQELEKAIMEFNVPPKVFIKQPLFENLKDVFGKDVEILVQN